MSKFESFVNTKVASANSSKSNKAKVGEAAVDAAKALLAFSEGLPYIGPVALLLNTAIDICAQRTCNKEAFDQLKLRLCHFSQLLLDEKGLAAIARERSQNEILKTFTNRMEDTLNEAIVHLGGFAKAWFFSSILSGSKPQQQFNKLDAELTRCLNELSIALHIVQINEQAQTYQIVCSIQSKIDNNGGLQGVSQNPALLQSLADEIGADVEDLAASVEIAKNGTSSRPVSGIKSKADTSLSPQSHDAAPVVSLKDLSIDQVCQLLDHQNLHSIIDIVVENGISGSVLCRGCSQTRQLKGIGISHIHAATLAKLIKEWNQYGLPASFVAELRSGPLEAGASDCHELPRQLPANAKQASSSNGVEVPKAAAAAKTLGKRKVSDSAPLGVAPTLELSKKKGKKADATLLAAAEVERWFSAARYCGDTSACQLLITAAEKGNHLAEAYLSILYDRGCSELAENADKALLFTQRALPWLQAEVVKGNKYAQFLLAFCCFDGRGVTKDEAEAVKLYKLAADQGLADALWYLGMCYMTGTGVILDEAEGARLYKLATDQGHAVVQCHLGACYQYGTGVAKDFVESTRLYKLAADQGYADAQFNLGWCYDSGTGVSKDEAEAARLYKLAADQGNVEAQNYLGEKLGDAR